MTFDIETIDMKVSNNTRKLKPYLICAYTESTGILHEHLEFYDEELEPAYNNQPLGEDVY